MKSKPIITTLSIIMFIVAGCATIDTAKHKYIMRGQILESTNEEAYICIGSADGAEVGQEYKIYKFTRMPDTKSNRPNYRKELKGKIIITEIVNDHYAKARVLSGEARENDVVELDR